MSIGKLMKLLIMKQCEINKTEKKIIKLRKKLLKQEIKHMKQLEDIRRIREI